MATAEQALNVMRGWIGLSRNAQTHRPIIDLYNSYKPLARGYAVTYWDDYCDTSVSAVFIKLGAVDLIGGTECGVHEHIQIFKNKGIWKGKVKPASGWIITFDWDRDGIADHIGLVESISGEIVTTVEANMNGGIVGRRTIAWNDNSVYGYATPNYEEERKDVYMFEFERIKQGDSGKTVKALQALLRGRGFIDKEKEGDNKSIDVDGIWGPSTQRAFEYFQEKCKIKVKNVCDKARWRRLLYR